MYLPRRESTSAGRRRGSSSRHKQLRRFGFGHDPCDVFWGAQSIPLSLPESSEAEMFSA